MRIAILSRYQSINRRGVESFVDELAKRLRKKYLVEIFSGENSDDLIRIIRGEFDLVLPMNGRIQSLKVSIGRLFGGYKVVIGGHSGIGRDDVWNIVVARPDVFVCLTEAEYLWAKNWAIGVPLKKIPNGIDLDRFKPVGQKFNFGLPSPIILSVGELVWYKYHDRVIEAVSRMSEGSLVIVGTGELQDKLRKLGEQKLGNRFKMVKAAYHEMPKIYRSADIFTLPSWDREAFGLVYLEAMASGLPVVASDDLSRREIVGNGGILADISDLDKYARALKDGLNKNWASKPREQAEKFSWDKIAKKYEELFESVVND